MSIKLLTEHHLEFLSLKGGCIGSYESPLVKMPHCWKSRVTAHIYVFLLPNIMNEVKCLLDPHVTPLACKLRPVGHRHFLLLGGLGIQIWLHPPFPFVHAFVPENNCRHIIHTFLKIKKSIVK